MKKVSAVAGQPGDQIFLLVVAEANDAFVVIEMPGVICDPAERGEDIRHLRLRDLSRPIIT